MKTISIIPARGGSKGIPSKNIKKLNGHPLIYYSINSSTQSKINRTIVSTDDEKIAHYAERYGAEVIMRPKLLATDKAQIEPTMIHVLNNLDKNEGYVPDTVVLLQNTSPLRNSTHIDQSLSLFKNKKFDSVFSGFISHYLLWKREKQRVTPINYNPMKRQNRQNMTDYVIENGAIYITKNTSFKKTKCRISGNIGIYLMPEEMSVQIDLYSDIIIAEQFLKYMKKYET